MTPAFLRPAAVAGSFYPSDPDTAAEFVRAHAATATAPAVAALAPHAGWTYSGALAAETLTGVAVPDTVVVLCPNHTGRGPAVSVYPRGAWRLPGGTISIDTAWTDALERLWGSEVLDTRAHEREHAIEVLLPFLTYRRSDVRLVAIVLGRLPVDACLEIAAGLAATARQQRPRPLLIASSDMTHYRPAREAARQDALTWPALDAVDAPALHDTVERHAITMCGYVPATVTLAAARALGATRGHRVGYTHSGAVTGDENSVVAYAGYRFA